MRTAAPNAVLTWDEAVRLLCSLPSYSESERIDVVAELVRSTSPAIRRRSLRLGADVLPDELLVAWLREDADDVLRNAGLEILKLRGGRAFSLVRDLARDADPDVVLQAALLLDHYRDPRGVTVLKSLLDHPDTNVVQAAIVGLGHHRDGAALKWLAPFLDADVWLQIATIQALGDIGDEGALALLEPLLADEFLEPFASEAIAHIGGASAFGMLSVHWLIHESTADAERYVSLLAAVIVQLSERFRLDPVLESAIVRQLSVPSASLRMSSATVLLASGSVAHARTAIDILATAEDAPSQLPACLVQRGDLAPLLIERSGVQLEWGLQLAARHALGVSARDIADAVLRGEIPEHLFEACHALADSSSDAAAGAVIAIFARVPAERRRDLLEAIQRHSDWLLEMLPDPRLDAVDELILAALAGLRADEVVRRVCALDPADRKVVVSQIFTREDVMTALPWNDWIDADAATNADLLADAVTDSNLISAAPLLRVAGRRAPSARVVEALGCIGDAASVDLLEELLHGADARMRVYIWNALGRIGGERARSIFRRISDDLPAAEAKFAYRAWAVCATADDVPYFRAVAAHPDWLVRAAVAEVLARNPDSSNSDVLSALALDPVEAVAEKAVAIAVPLGSRK